MSARNACDVSRSVERHRPAEQGLESAKEIRVGVGRPQQRREPILRVEALGVQLHRPGVCAACLIAFALATEQEGFDVVGAGASIGSGTPNRVDTGTSSLRSENVAERKVEHIRDVRSTRWTRAQVNSMRVLPRRRGRLLNEGILVGARPVDRRHRHIQLPQIHRQLATMVIPVVQHDRA